MSKQYVSKRIKLLSAVVDDISSEEIIEKIVTNKSYNGNLFVSYLTAWSLVIAEKDSEFSNILNETDICAADGMGAVLAAFLTSFKLIKKVTLHDYYKNLLREIEARKLRVALIGGYDGLSESACKIISNSYPKINICVQHTGFINLNNEKKLLNDLVLQKPDIVFLSMSQPVQEKWYYKHLNELPKSAYICTGAFFEFITGYVKPLPKSLIFIRHIGMEWVWRLIHDPKKLWRRYLIGIPQLFLNISAFYVKLIFLKR